VFYFFITIFAVLSHVYIGPAYFFVILPLCALIMKLTAHLHILVSGLFSVQGSHLKQTSWCHSRPNRYR